MLKKMINSNHKGFTGFLFLVLVFGGCNDMNLKLKCRHKVLAIATALQEKYIVKIETGKLKNGEIYHAQVKARTNGSWEYFWSSGDYIVETADVLGEKRREFEVEEYVKYLKYLAIENRLKEVMKRAREVFP